MAVYQVNSTNTSFGNAAVVNNPWTTSAMYLKWWQATTTRTVPNSVNSRGMVYLSVMVEEIESFNQPVARGVFYVHNGTPNTWSRFIIHDCGVVCGLQGDGAVGGYMGYSFKGRINSSDTSVYGDEMTIYCIPANVGGAGSWFCCHPSTVNWSLATIQAATSSFTVNNNMPGSTQIRSVM